jgi:trans-2,3-dihydro-3-hydroxyanthranilate isomerase
VENAGNDFRVRFFFEAHGVREDAATGNGAAFLGAYLIKHQLLAAGETTLRIEQGHALRRPSLVLVRVRAGEKPPRIDVGGRVVPIIEGSLL